MTYVSNSINPIVFNSIPYSELNTDYLAVFANYTSIRSTLEAQSNILDMLYNDDHSKVESLVWAGFIANSLMALAEEMSDYSFNQNALNLDLTMAASIINANTAGYGTSDFISDMYSHLSTTHYTNIMRAKYGVAGDFDEFLTLTEQDLYGSKRLGAIQTSVRIHEIDYSGSLSGTTGSGTITQSFVSIATSVSMTSFSRILGEKQYELTNHLGNVLAVITDKKVCGHAISGYADYYIAEVIHQQDYYPFGSPMPGRKYDLSGTKIYRFGFNGMERGDEVYGDGDEYTTKFRQYDPRLGRWLSIDPDQIHYEHVSPYIAMDNNPIIKTDIYGNSWDTWVDALKHAVQEASESFVDGAGKLGGAIVDVAEGAAVVTTEAVGLTVVFVLMPNTAGKGSEMPYKKPTPKPAATPVKTTPAKTKEPEKKPKLVTSPRSEEEHKKNARPSTKEKHENGQAVKKRSRNNEKGDARRGYNRKKPDGHTGPWPPKNK